MKQIYTLTFFLFLGILNLEAQTIFDWDTAPIDNGDNVTETINGITTTFTGSSTAGFIETDGFGGSSGNVVINSEDGSELTTNVTFYFSESVVVTSILALEAFEANIDFTFTPVGGSNATILATLVEGIAQVNLNWTDITSFTVSSSGSTFAFDNLVITSSILATNDFALKTTKVFPNPSIDFIEITGLTTIENYKIYNTIGQEVKRGIVVENEKINIRNLTNGIYFLKLEDGNSIKIIKNK